MAERIEITFGPSAEQPDYTTVREVRDSIQESSNKFGLDKRITVEEKDSNGEVIWSISAQPSSTE